MREIKFRAWDKGHNKMSYDVNLYSLDRSGAMNKAQIDNQQIMKTIGFACEVMQFTGLKDKVGKEIYEGDILLSASSKEKYVVEWHHAGWFRRSLDYGQGMTSLTVQHKNQTVIGNIYEHSKMLKLLTT